MNGTIMKYLLSFIAGIVIAGSVCFFLIRQQSQHQCRNVSAGELVAAGESVEKKFREYSQDIADRLSAFANEVAADQLFALRLLV